MELAKTMAPKFDDFHKATKDALQQDLLTAGYEFKTKQKTKFNGAVVTCTSALFKGATTTKFSWKMPSFFGVPGVSVEKLEMDSKGKFKLEAAVDQGVHCGPEGSERPWYCGSNMKVLATSDLASVEGVAVEATFTDIKTLPGAQVKFETKPMDLANFDFAGEITYENGPATLGLKLNKASLFGLKPDIGGRFQQGPFCASVLTKDMLSSFIAHGHYKVPCAYDPLVLASYEYGGKKSGEYHLGVDVNALKSTRVRAKLHEGSQVSISVEHKVAAGFKLIGGAKFSSASDYTTGFGLHIE